MKTDTLIFERGLQRLSEGMKRAFRPGTQEFLGWLRGNDVPAEIVQHFSQYSVTEGKGVEIGYATFWPEHDIRAIHEETLEYSQAGWLIIGAMPNGDFPIIDITKNGAIYYVSHEEVWDRPDHVREDLRGIQTFICDSVGQFLDGLLEDRYPYDYSEAIERLGNRQ